MISGCFFGGPFRKSRLRPSKSLPPPPAPSNPPAIQPDPLSVVVAIPSLRYTGFRCKTAQSFDVMPHSFPQEASSISIQFLLPTRISLYAAPLSLWDGVIAVAWPSKSRPPLLADTFAELLGRGYGIFASNDTGRRTDHSQKGCSPVPSTKWIWGAQETEFL